MFSIFCSNKLADFLGIPKSAKVKNGDGDKFYQWNAHMFYIDKRKCIIITNKSTLYSIIQLDIKKNELMPFNIFFTNSLLSQLSSENILFENVNSWINENSVEINLLRTDNDKSVIGSMNDFISLIKHVVFSEPNINYADKDSIKSNVNNSIMKSVNYNTPTEELKNKLKPA